MVICSYNFTGPAGLCRLDYSYKHKNKPIDFVGPHGTLLFWLAQYYHSDQERTGRD
jgi:hypothetical protein